MSGSYPIHVELSGLRLLVVGGGQVAERKVSGLLTAGGAPDLVAPALTPDLRRWVGEHDLAWAERRYRPGDAEGYRLVFATTDDPEVNRFVVRDAEAAGALVNAANLPGASSFRVPAVHRAGGIMVSCATHGAAPAFARRVRDRIAGVVTPGLGRAAERLAGVRGDVRRRWPEDESRRRAFWDELVTDAFLDAATEGRDEEVESMIERCLSRS